MRVDRLLSRIMITQTPTPLSDLRLSNRTHDALHRAGITTIEELQKRTTDELLLTVLNFGIHGAREVEAAIAAYRRAIK